MKVCHCMAFGNTYTSLLTLSISVSVLNWAKVCFVSNKFIFFIWERKKCFFSFQKLNRLSLKQALMVKYVLDEGNCASIWLNIDLFHSGHFASLCREIDCIAFREASSGALVLCMLTHWNRLRGHLNGMETLMLLVTLCFSCFDESKCLPCERSNVNRWKLQQCY